MNLQKSLLSVSMQFNSTVGRTTHLITITPLEVLGADVLVGVLSALWQRGKMAPVLPVFVPQPVRIGSSDNKCRDNAASVLLALSSSIRTSPTHSSCFPLIESWTRQGEISLSRGRI